MRRIVLLITLLLIIGCTQQTRPLKPIRATATVGGIVLPEPRVLTFAEIASTPQQFINQPVRVTGEYSRLELVDCPLFKGPHIEWAMVADSLQMNAVGFEQVVGLAQEGIEFTVDGIWRQYFGPSGCGKEPATEAVWYLEVTQILRPNPISQFAQSGNVAGAPLESAVDPTQPDTTLPDAVDPAAPPAGGSTDDQEGIPVPNENDDALILEPTLAPTLAQANTVPTVPPPPTSTPTTQPTVFIPPTATATLIPPTPTPSPTSTSAVTNTPTSSAETETETETPTPTLTITVTAVETGTVTATVTATATIDGDATPTVEATSDGTATATVEPALLTAIASQTVSAQETSSAQGTPTPEDGGGITDGTPVPTSDATFAPTVPGYPAPGTEATSPPSSYP